MTRGPGPTCLTAWVNYLVTQEDKVKPFHGKLHAECGCRINSGIMVVNATTLDTAAMETVTVNASASTTHTNVAAL
jgi:hypothetical protein